MRRQALVYVPRESWRYWSSRGHAHCARRGHEVIDTIIGQWDCAAAQLESGRVQVIVVGSRGHIPAGGIPGVEVIGEQTPRPREPPPDHDQTPDGGRDAPDG